MNVSAHSIALAANGIRFRHGRQMVLNGIDLSVASTELLCLLGTSGSGKTTLLRIFAGLLDPAEGDVVIDGISQKNVPANQRDIGYVFQETGALFPHLNVFDNVMFPFRAGRHINTGTEPAVRVREVLNHLGIDSDRHKALSELSGGEKQRVALARALVYQPRLLLLDEPTASLDNKTKRSFIELLLEYRRKQPFTCVFVTHDEREACAVGDRIAVLGRNGKILQDDEPNNIRLNPSTVEVAEIIRGWNLLPVQNIGGKLTCLDGKVIVDTNLVSCAPGCPLQEDAHYFLGFRGASALPTASPATSIRWTVTVTGIESQEYSNVVVCAPPPGSSAAMRVVSRNGHLPSLGSTMQIEIPISAFRLFPQL